MQHIKDLLYDSYITNLVSQLIITIIVVLWLKTKDKWLVFVRLFHFVQYTVTRRKVVLFWCDNDEVAKKWNSMYRHRLKNVIVNVVKTPSDLLKYKLSPKSVICVILFNTDVSKMSLNEAQNERIQKHIIDYVQKGGVLLASHDNIYRRVRNNLLESEYRCQINSFQRDEKPIEYVINQDYKNCPIFTDLSESFFLTDGEVCWGNWGIDVQVLCSSRKLFNHKKNIPLLTFIKSNKGGYFWINSGDTFEKPCDSVCMPEAPLITLVDNLIKHKHEILQYLMV